MHNILLVEDDKEINFILSEFLKRKNYIVTSCYTGITAISELSSSQYDLLLLDLMLPDLSGEKIMEHIKKDTNPIPVIIISAKTQPDVRIDLLRSGADDFITKPFYHEEVLARIESVLRRCSSAQHTNYSFKDISLNIEDHTAIVNNVELILTATEYKLLEKFIRQPQQIFTKESLYQTIWEKDYLADDNTLNVHISNLRKKLDEFGKSGPYIDTVWGIGYRLNNNKN